MNFKYVSNWQRGVTAKKYLHPPFCERLVTLWPDAKVVIGTIYGVGEEQPESCGFRILRGDPPTAFPREETQQSARADGIPIHSILRRTNRCFFEMECFCDIKRIPTVFVKVTMDNQSGYEADEHMTILLRKGKETTLTGSDDDGYSPYLSDCAPWLFMPSHAVFKDGILSEGEYRFSTNGKEAVDVGNGMIRLDFKVPPKEKREFYFAFGENAPGKFDYVTEREKTERFWKEELSAIKTVPATDDAEIQTAYTNFVAQLLQFYCIPKGHDYVLPRQGSMQRLIWPSEEMPVIMALSKAGDFSKYLRPVMDTYFGILQQESGQIVNFGVPWASVTSCCLYGFAAYTLDNNDREYFEKYRKNALKAVEWIEQTRKSTYDNPNLFGGLFPPMRSCDYEQPGAQCWGQTDVYNLDSYRALIATFKHFNAEGLEQIEQANDSYRAVMKAIVDNLCEKNTGNFTLPVDPHDDPEREAEFDKGIAPRREGVTPMILNLNLIDETTDIPERLENGCRELGVFGPGLTWLMADRGVFRDGHKVWYGSWTDLEWFKYYERSGQHDKMKEILDAQLKYIMTPEYYMMERYDQTNPFYAPWLPNASNNGRTMLMMLSYYGSQNV